MCCLLLAAYATLAWTSVETQSATFDEPYHALSAWVQLRQHDYRIDCEDPPLWLYWASLPNGPSAVGFDPADPQWRDMPDQLQLQWPWCVRTLYRTPGTDGIAIVRRCRAMMLPLAVALGALVARWAWRIAGPAAAVVAVGLFCLDPNLLAHGPLMKNDVVFSLALTALAMALWRAGLGLTVTSAAAVIASAAVMLTVKFSGLIAVPLVPLMLGVRAVLPEPWSVLGRTAPTRAKRLAVAAALSAATALACYAAIWTAYGFRYAATPDPTVHLPLNEVAVRAADNAAFARGDAREPAPLPASVRTALAAAAHHALPEAYLGGLLFTYANMIRPAFLLGRVSYVGWWYYFPLAMAFKTPVATLLAGTVALAMAVRRRPWRHPATRWAAAAVAVPFALFLASALRANLNIGLRHVLPLYPLGFVATGCIAAAALRRAPRTAQVTIALLAAGLFAETVAARPNYLSFFNAPAATLGRGGFDLLSDSNLDWGQDLIALADWRRAHPDDPLYLSYFGLADPRAYGLQYVPLPGGYRYDEAPRRFPDRGRACWLAVSVMTLQGVVAEDDRLRAYYQRLAARPPTAIVGASIYVYRYDPVDALRPPQGR